MTPRWSPNGAFTTTTRPTLAQVEKWIDNASSTLNVMLANAGFTTPITQADAKAACGEIIVEVVADLVVNANSSGRFYTEKALAAGSSPMATLRKDMQDWVDSMASGLVTLGVSRVPPVTVSCVVTNPTFERDAVDATTTTDEIGVLVT